MSLDEDRLRKAFTALQARVTYLEGATGLFATDEDLDSPHGDPMVRFAPRAWRGPEVEVKGRRYSECPPDFLEVLAEALSWSASQTPKAGAKDYRESNKRDAGRARAWARRLRAGGWTPPAKPERPAGRPTAGGRAERPARAPGARPGGHPRRGDDGRATGSAPASTVPHDADGVIDEAAARALASGVDPNTGQVADDGFDDGEDGDPGDAPDGEDDWMDAPDLGFEH